MGPGFESLKADHVYKRLAVSYKACWPVGQVVKTEASHAFNIGSNPVRVTTFLKARHAESVVTDRKVVNIYIVGADWCEGPPVPIPNTEVKLTCAEDTCRVTDRENR